MSLFVLNLKGSDKKRWDMRMTRLISCDSMLTVLDWIKWFRVHHHNTMNKDCDFMFF